MTRTKLNAIEHLFNQGIDLLRTIDHANYTTPIEQLDIDTVGAHFRHVLDHYHAVVVGVKTGIIDYDVRTRGSIVQTNRRAGIDALVNAIVQLNQLDVDSRSLATLSCANGVQRSAAKTSIVRELDWIALHTVHHYAIIAVSCRWWNIRTPSNFGIAPATLRSKETSATTAGLAIPKNRILQR